MTVDRPLDALVDTSVAVAVLQASHALHAVAMDARRGRRLGISGHAWFETYSVLTRLPAGQRRSPHAVQRAMTAAFPETRFLGPDAARDLAGELARLEIAGGSVYDALVAATAREHALPLMTGDRRARSVYELLGIRVLWVGEPSGWSVA
jgi:predicted nucleic acid-binding protein